jgi:hypothetical protein
VEYGSRKTEIPAASCGHCSYLSRAARRPDAGRLVVQSEQQRNPQLEELARTLAQQVVLNLRR